MTLPPTTSSNGLPDLGERQRAFVQSLYDLCATGGGREAGGPDSTDRMTLVYLRHSVTRDRPDLTVTSLVFAHDPPSTQIDAWMLTAGLFGYAPQPAPPPSQRHSLGTAMGLLANARDGDGTERRMRHLLEADPANLPYYVREAVQLVHQAEIALDFHRLLKDLVVLLRRVPEGRDPHARNDVLLRWGADYQRARRSDASSQDSEQ
ncbi:type I-E CRISPR-associated protein Cse2/CasB [Streptomyces sp. NPDC048172]|uniref:type I-E CRISPR-associated protein Cse2/CasB n=1 Tax=Streptomyces sp. NPDC048172 TaxID=3365505 RepID=UPI003717FA5F